MGLEDDFCRCWRNDRSCWKNVIQFECQKRAIRWRRILKVMETIQIKRVYEAPSKSDGYRILVDRIWPRGVSKEEAKLDAWNKDLAPSTELRKWFDHDPDKFEDFSKKYKKELKDKAEVLKQLTEKANDQTVTLLYGAKDTKYNQAVVLKEVLKGFKK